MNSKSKLIASTSRSFQLKMEATTIQIDYIKNTDIEFLVKQIQSGRSNSRKMLSLHFENMRGNETLPNIDIYLNLEQESRPNDKNYVGALGLYGLVESSVPSREQNGSGQNRIFYVGQVFNYVHSQSNWSRNQFKLTFFPDNYNTGSVKASLSIGLIALYFHES